MTHPVYIRVLKQELHNLGVASSSCKVQGGAELSIQQVGVAIPFLQQKFGGLYLSVPARFKQPYLKYHQFFQLLLCSFFFSKQTDPSLNHFLNAVRHVFFLTITFVRLSEEKLEQIAHTSMHNGWGPSGHCPAVSQKNHCPAVWKEALCLPRKHCDAGGSHPPTGDLFTTKNMTSHVVFKGYGLYNGFEFETIILIKKKTIAKSFPLIIFLRMSCRSVVLSTVMCVWHIADSFIHSLVLSHTGHAMLPFLSLWDLDFGVVWSSQAKVRINDDLIHLYTHHQKTLN